MNIKIVLNRYKYAIIWILISVCIYIYDKDIAQNIFKSAKYSTLQMLSILPGVMILLALLDEWVDREYFMKYMGEDSKGIGVVMAFMLAFFAAGPMYAAFPFTEVLMKKGVKFSNIIIFLNAWCVAKFSTLTFEVDALGYKFTLVRLFINIVGVVAMGYIVEYFYKLTKIT